jgi:hypothetical protein
MEVDNRPENDITMIPWWRLQNVSNEVRAKGLVEVVVVATVEQVPGN